MKVRFGTKDIEIEATALRGRAVLGKAIELLPGFPPFVYLAPKDATVPVPGQYVGRMLVARTTNPDMIQTMRESVAFLTESGGLLSHAAITAREMGRLALVGMGHDYAKVSAGAHVVYNVEANTYHLVK